MTRRISSLIAILIALFAFSFDAAAEEPEEGFSEADEILLRADSRYYQGDYYRALGDYSDFLWRYPNDHRVDRVRLKKAWVHYAGDDFREAANILDELSTERTDDLEGWWARFYFAQVAMEAGRTPLANSAFEEVLEYCEPFVDRFGDDETYDPNVENCLELTARTRLALADVRTSRHDFDGAIGHLQNVPDESPWAEEASAEVDVFRNISIPRKSPALAGTLSIIPGFGHFYLGEYGTGFLAMAWNGIFIYGLVDSILNQNYGQAALIGLLESVWYSGTIFGSIAGAHRHNRDARRVVEDGLRRNINSIAEDDDPWPARFPARTPAYLELRLDF